VLLADGEQRAVRAKSLLPAYDVFDERRYFARAHEREPVELPGHEMRLGLAVCEDTWSERIPYDVEPVAELVEQGASAILNPSASPWHAGKARARREMLASTAQAHCVPIVFVNQVGGNDELIFDGGSFVVDAKGRVHAALPAFEEGFALVDLPLGEAGTPVDEMDGPEPAAELESGLVLGIRDYFFKQNLPPGAVIGLSGGIDSAVTAHLAVKALGAERVLGIAMPGPFSSGHSTGDALELGRKLGIEVRKVDIRPVYESFLRIFESLFGRKNDYGLTQQNIQSRIRGAILMAVSNQENRLVLATGNKSELSMGYCTLYGDTVGGLAVLGDVYKHDVYALARHANQSGERIPSNTIEKPPSAELAPDQADSDDLPDYDILDALLTQAIEGGRSGASLEPPPGCTPETALEVSQRLDRNEYKRRQSPLVLRTSAKAFGRGRRLPIVHSFSG
jgi:NAD+ synthetase